MPFAKILAFDATRSISDLNNTPKGLVSGGNRMPDIALNKLWGNDLAWPAADDNQRNKGCNYFRIGTANLPPNAKTSDTLNSGFWTGKWENLTVSQVQSLAGQFANRSIIFLDLEADIDYYHPNTNRNIAVLGYYIKQANPNIKLNFWFNPSAEYKLRTSTADLRLNFFRSSGIGQAYAWCVPSEHVAAFGQNLTVIGAINDTHSEAGNQSILQIWNTITVTFGYDDFFWAFPTGQNLSVENDSTAAVGLGLINAIHLIKKQNPNLNVVGFFWYCVESAIFTEHYFAQTSLGGVRHTDKVVYPANIYKAACFWALFFGDGCYHWFGLGEVTTNIDKWLYYGHPSHPDPNVRNVTYLGSTPYNAATYNVPGYHLTKEAHILDAALQAAQMYSQVQSVCDVATATSPAFEYRRQNRNASGVESWSNWTSYTPPTNGAAAAQCMLDKVPFVSMKTSAGQSVVAAQDFWANVPYSSEIRLMVGGSSETMQLNGNSISVYKK